jgi:hypothetical protein
MGQALREPWAELGSKENFAPVVFISDVASHTGQQALYYNL